MTTLATMTERQSWKEFEHSASIPSLNLRATTAGDSVATAATGFEGSVPLSILQSIRKYERDEGMSFRLHLSSRDRLKFQTPFLKFRPYCGWTANGGGRL